MVLVFDLDGVVYLGETPIPGAIETLRTLEAAGHRIYFITNNSTRSREDYARKLARMGYPIPPERVVTSAYATALHLRARGAEGKRVYVVGENGLREEMRAAGLQVVEDGDPAPADFVVVGLDRTLTYARLERAHREIAQRGAVFIATNRDATYPTETGTIPGGGSMVAAIEYSTGVTAATIGKPEPYAWELILHLAGATADQALMVGDRPETDILGARRVGMRTALVLTGVTDGRALDRLPEEQRPDFVLRDLTELPRLAAEVDPGRDER